MSLKAELEVVTQSKAEIKNKLPRLMRPATSQSNSKSVIFVYAYKSDTDEFKGIYISEDYPNSVQFSPSLFKSDDLEDFPHKLTIKNSND